MIDYYHYSPKGPGNEEPDENAVSNSLEEQPKRKRRFLKWFLVILVSLLLLLAAVLFGTYLVIKNSPLKSTNGRTNIVILGVDSVAALSDTIILASVDHTDPKTPRAALISIPRDLYVPVSGNGYAKINAAYSIGERTNYKGGGAALSVATIEDTFDIPVHYYAALDFKGFERIIDTIGGVTIDVKTNINDPLYPAPNYAGYEPFKISKGERHMNGETALKYARSRQTTNDYDRAFRQQQVVLAVREKLLSTDILLDYNTLSTLVEVVDQNVDTSLKPREMIRLALIVRELKDGQTKQYVLDTTNLLGATFNETGSALVPRSGDFLQIQDFIKNIFNQNEIEEFKQNQF